MLDGLELASHDSFFTVNLSEFFEKLSDEECLKCIERVFERRLGWGQDLEFSDGWTQEPWERNKAAKDRVDERMRKHQTSVSAPTGSTMED